MVRRGLRPTLALAILSAGASAVSACNAIIGNSRATLDPGDATTSDAPDAAVADDAPRTCGEGTKLCLGVCVPLNDPGVGCGNGGCAACALPGAQALLCATDLDAGVFRCSANGCHAPFLDCNRNGLDGCEVDPLAATTCGGCDGSACADATPLCARDPTSGAYGCTDRCPDGSASCDSGSCLDLQSDPVNCGGCGRRCTTVTSLEFGTCDAGACGVDCVSIAHLCPDGHCYLLRDPDHCGVTCEVCPEPPSPKTERSCVGNQVNGFTCGSACMPGYGDCNGNGTGSDNDGCETPLGTDLNCSSCGNACTSPKRCTNGACKSVAAPDGAPGF